jgi:hypothetical protein
MQTNAQIENKVGTLSKPSKMPCHGYGLNPKKCKVGGRLVKIVGSICSKCYAMRGNYLFPVVVAMQDKRLAAIKRAGWVAGMVELIRRKEGSGFFRWHDAGDVQSLSHLQKIVDIAKALPRIKFWLPTREYNLVAKWIDVNGKFPRNLTVRLSAHMIDGKPPVKLAKRLGLTTSGVSTGGFNCPASKQGNFCRDCRACWTSKKNINYKKH